MNPENHGSEVKLKDGRRALIRPVRVEDAARLLEHERAVHRAGEGVVQSMQQLWPTPDALARDLAAWTDGARGGEHGCMLVCDADGVITGSARISRMVPSRCRHVAHLSVDVHPQWQGVGIGRALMNGLLAWAKSPSGKGIIRIDLGVFAVNTRAIRLYESLGFRIEGTRKRFIRFEDGSWSDDHIMALMLDQ